MIDTIHLDGLYTKTHANYIWGIKSDEAKVVYELILEQRRVGWNHLGKDYCYDYGSLRNYFNKIVRHLDIQPLAEQYAPDLPPTHYTLYTMRRAKAVLDYETTVKKLVEEGMKNSRVAL
jgi:hypothetical protein